MVYEEQSIIKRVQVCSKTDMQCDQDGLGQAEYYVQSMYKYVLLLYVGFLVQIGVMQTQFGQSIVQNRG